MIEIVKVQRVLASNDPTMKRQVLVYAKGRHRMVQQNLDDTAKAAMGADVKAFFEADFQPRSSCWLMGKRVANQNW
jgi:hypothetical protein